MIAASIIGIFVIPMLYVTFQYFSEWIDRRRGIDPEVKYGSKQKLETSNNETATPPVAPAH